MTASVLTVDTLYWDTVGGLLLAAVCFLCLLNLCRVGDFKVFYRWMRSWLPTYESGSPHGDGQGAASRVTAIRHAPDGSNPSHSHFPAKPIWMDPAYYQGSNVFECRADEKETAMLTRDEAINRVTRGAAHLDVVRPVWFNEIDPGTLTLHDPCGCIVGQLCGSNSETFATFGNLMFDFGTVRAGADLNFSDFDGFAGGEYDARRRAAYALLQDAWIAAIAARRFPDRATEGDTERSASATPTNAAGLGMEQPVLALRASESSSSNQDRAR